MLIQKQYRKVHRQFLPITISFILLLTCSGCTRKEEPVSRTDFKLNTVVTITLYDTTDTALLDGCMELCDHYELLFSRTDPDSELYKLNHGLLPHDGNGQIVSDEMAELIALGLSYGKLSDGAFDITIAPVSSLWDFGSDTPSVPEAEKLREAQTHVDYRKVSVTGNVVTFLEDNMAIDLGAIAKGYIADRIQDYLLENGVKSATINLGGNVLCMGSKNGTLFRVGIQKPFAPQGESVTTVSVTDHSIVSSGTYERYFKQGGILYHHILDPRTGYPCESGLDGVTILSAHSVDGDALSTTCFLLGAEKGLALIETLPDTEALFITESGDLLYSSGFDK